MSSLRIPCLTDECSGKHEVVFHMTHRGYPDTREEPGEGPEYELEYAENCTECNHEPTPAQLDELDLYDLIDADQHKRPRYYDVDPAWDRED
jgi:hypothetical protein